MRLIDFIILKSIKKQGSSFEHISHSSGVKTKLVSERLNYLLLHEYIDYSNELYFPKRNSQSCELKEKKFLTELVENTRDHSSLKEHCLYLTNHDFITYQDIMINLNRFLDYCSRKNNGDFPLKDHFFIYWGHQKVKDFTQGLNL